jgi:uncharacterized protein (DUF952 family)
MDYIYHIVLPDSWAKQFNVDTYQHDSLETEGFIKKKFGKNRYLLR